MALFKERLWPIVKNRQFAALARGLTGPTLIALVALALLWESGEIPIPANFGGVSPALWPRMALLGILTGVGIRSFEVINRYRAAPRETENEAQQSFSPLRAGIIVAICIITVLLIDIAGFAIANFVFLLVFLRVVGVRSNTTSLLIAVAATIGMLYFFVKLVYVPLPRGAGAFEDITIALYRLLGIF